MCDNHVKLPTNNDFKKLKYFEEELESEWDQISTLKTKGNKYGNKELSSTFAKGPSSKPPNSKQSIEELAAAQI
jgi:hypothetical protein